MNASIERDAAPTANRRHQVVAAAITVLATKGSRGLTHRAVDHEAHLAVGSTSNLYRTRSALIGAVVAQLVADDQGLMMGLDSVLDPGGNIGKFLADFISQTIEHRRDETLARFALLADPDASALLDGHTQLAEHVLRRAQSNGHTVAPSVITLTHAFIDGVLAESVIFGVSFDHNHVAEVINHIFELSTR